MFDYYYNLYFLLLYNFYSYNSIGDEGAKGLGNGIGKLSALTSFTLNLG